MARVKSADRVIQILEAIGSKKNGLTQRELAVELEIPKGSLSPLLSNLVDRGYLTLDRSKLYMLGPNLVVLTGRYLSSLEIVRIGRPIVQQLVSEIDEDTEIVVMKGDEVLFLHKEECSKPLKYSIAIGELAPVYATSAGKAILAHLPETEVERYLTAVGLAPITKTSITDPDAMKRELKEIRAIGLAYGREEFHQGICGIAAPVFNLYGNVAGAVVVTLPSIRFNRETKGFIEPRLKEAASRLSRHLGFAREDKKIVTGAET
jgi:IclR family transcriptional regulator, KDG regulon repressor